MKNLTNILIASLIFSSTFTVDVLADDSTLDLLNDCRRSTNQLGQLKLDAPLQEATVEANQVRDKCKAALDAVEANGARQLLSDGYRAFFAEDFPEAFGYFQAAAEKGYLLAFEAIYRLTAKSKNETTRSRAISSLKTAASLGSPQASLAYGAHLIKQPATAEAAVPQELEGMKYLWVASEFGESSATQLLSKLYGRKGNVLYRSDVSDALLLKAAEQGSLEASLQWARSQTNKQNSNKALLNKILKQAYLIGNTGIIKEIHGIYVELGDVDMSRIFMCLFIDTLQPGLSAVNGAWPGDIPVNRNRKREMYESCLAKYR